jgi:biotin carboxylase
VNDRDVEARTLVVLGGADGAITTVRTARRLGLRTICVDARADAPAIRDADEHLGISTRDGDRLVEVLAARTDLAGVASPASDVNLPTQYLLANRLKLPGGLSAAALRASVDKGYFRSVCDELGQPGPRYVQGTPGEVIAGAAALSFPVIVKPTDSSGGRGISQCPHPGPLAAAVARAADSSASRVVIVEEYLAGTHYTAEAVVRDGRIALFGLGRRELTPPPHFVTTEHVMPGAPPELTATVARMLDEACRALAYRWGSLNADVLVTTDGRIVLIELGARLGGNGSAELLGAVNGIDVTEAYVRMSVGQRPPLTPRRAAFAAFRVLRAPRAGTLLALAGVDAVRALPEVAELVISAVVGERVEPYHRAGAKLGYVLAAAADPEQLSAALARVQELLRVEVAEAATGADAGPPIVAGRLP